MDFRCVTTLFFALLVVKGRGQEDVETNILSVLKGPFRPGGTMPDWNVGGSTVITDNYIRLTPAEAAHAGSIWTKDAVPYREWEIDVQFKVTGARYLGGDGFAVWITEKSDEFGGTFGNKDEFKGLGIIFDTYDNDGQRDNPSISAIVSDGSLRFNHDSDGAGQKIANAQCNINFRNSRNPVAVRIRYQNRLLRVLHDINGNEEFVECFKSSDVQLPDQYFIGITAHTGQVADNHDIYFLRVSNLGSTVPNSQSSTSLAVENSAAKPNTPPAINQVDGHQLNESTEEQHKWKQGDDRHLLRFADSVSNWAEKSDSEREKLIVERRKFLEKNSEAETGGQGSGDIGGSVSLGSEEKLSSSSTAASGASILKSIEEEKRIVFDAISEQQHFRDEVSSTLAMLQAEVKAISHEMRGTLTLAHATPQSSGEVESNNAGSMSELLSSISDVLKHSQKALSDDIASSASSLRLKLESFQRDQSALTTMLSQSNQVQQEARDRLLEVASQVKGLQAAVAEGPRRRELDLPGTAKEAAGAAGQAGSGGVSWVVLLLTHVPWVAYAVYARCAGSGHGRESIFPLHRPQANKYI